MCGRTRFGALAGNRMRRMVQGNRERRRKSGANNTTGARNQNAASNGTTAANNSNTTQASISGVQQRLLEDTRSVNNSNGENPNHDSEGSRDVPVGWMSEGMDCSDIPHIENFGPGMRCPTIINGGNGYEIRTMAWGLIPTYFPSDEKGNHFQIFNKRIEGLAPEGGETAGKYFLQLIKSKRCVALFDGFFEWKLIAGKKQPYYVHFANDEPLIMPGIYEDSQFLDFRDLKPINLPTFAILTGHSCAQFEVVHSRQPTFVTPEQAERWLNPELSSSELDALLEELRMAPSKPDTVFSSWLHFYPVTKKITEMKYQQSDCTKEISLGRDMMSFYGKGDIDKHDIMECLLPMEVKVEQDAEMVGSQQSTTLSNNYTKLVSSPVIKKESRSLFSIKRECELPDPPGKQIPVKGEAATTVVKEEIEEIDLTGEDDVDGESSQQIEAIEIPKVTGKRGIDAILKEERQLKLLNTPMGKFLTSNSTVNASPSPSKKRDHKRLDSTPIKQITRYFKAN